MTGRTRAGLLLADSYATRGLVRWLYTSNPFYVISAGLVLFGLNASFSSGGKPFESGMLLVGLIGYELVLATTAWGLIRFGKVWDDVRTLLLLVVLLFLIISANFDYTLVVRPQLGQLYYLAGWFIAIAISEGLLRGIGLNLPALFRGPYHLILGLFFLYPVFLGWLSKRPDSAELQWALFAFPTVAGLLFLTLLPAIRLGPAYVAKNGSPWRWPLYPWVLFGLLAAGALVRSYWVCLSFHFVPKASNIFGPYFLVPLLLALVVLLVEIGRSVGHTVVVRLAMAAPLGMVAIALAGHRADPVYLGFLKQFTSTLGGTPAYLTLICLVVFYALSAFRKIPLAFEGLALAVAGLTFIGPMTFRVSDFTAARPWPLAAAALVVLIHARAARPSALWVGCMRTHRFGLDFAARSALIAVEDRTHRPPGDRDGPRARNPHG